MPQHDQFTVDPNAAIGIFDSGLGGLSVLREVIKEMPAEQVVYFADTAHMPYGPRPLAEVRGFAETIVGRLIQFPAKVIVVACNTASAAALKYLRQVYPGIPFVGMEPAVKPAAAVTRSGKVGVLATQATFQGDLFESVVERFARGTEVIRQACPGLAECIEHHPPDHPILRAMLEKYIGPLVETGVDSLVLACTHYPLVADLIADVAGEGIAVVDPSPAIARRTRHVLEEVRGLTTRTTGSVMYLVNGDADAFSRSASLLLHEPVVAAKVKYRVR